MQSNSKNEQAQAVVTKKHRRLLDIGIELDYPFTKDGLCLGLAEAGRLAALDSFEAFIYFTNLLDFILNTPEFSSQLKKAKESIAKKNQESKTISLSKEEQLFLDANALFDSIALSFCPHNYQELLGEFVLQPQSFTKIPTYLESKKLKEKGGPVIVDDFSGIYDAKESENFGALLIEIANNSECDITFSINHINHSINVYYNKKQDAWFLIDANKLELLEKKDGRIVPIKKEELGQIIFSTSSEPNSEVQAFHVKISIAGNDKEKFPSTYKKHELYALLHEITEKKAKSKTRLGVTLAHHAAMFNDLNTLEKIQVNNGSLNEKMLNGRTPLHYAAIFNNFEAINKLLEIQSFDINQTDDKGMTPLLYLGKKLFIETNDRSLTVEKTQQSILLLLEKKADLFSEVPKDSIIIQYAIISFLMKQNNVDLMKKIIQAQSEMKAVDIINKQALFRDTPLHIAIKYGSLDVINFLLEQKEIDLNLKNEMNLSSIEFIFTNHENSIEILELFINKEGDDFFSRKFSDDMTLVHLAALYGRLDILDHLLKKHPTKIDLNALDISNNTPLHLAAHNQHQSIVQLLIDHKALVMELNKTGFAPIHYAAKNGDASIYQLLKKNQGSCRTLNEGSSFLHIAAQFGQTKFLSDFFGSAPDIVQSTLKMKNNFGQTISDVAASHKQWEVAHLLYFLEKHQPVNPSNLNDTYTQQFIAAYELKESTISSWNKDLHDEKINIEIENKIITEYKSDYITFFNKFNNINIEEYIKEFILAKEREQKQMKQEQEQMKQVLSSLNTYIQMHHWESKSGEKYPGIVSMHLDATASLLKKEKLINPLYLSIMGKNIKISSSISTDTMFMPETPTDYKIFLGQLRQSATPEEALKFLEKAISQEKEKLSVDVHKKNTNTDH